MIYDDNDRAFRRAEQAWLTPPEYDECGECGEPTRDGASLCDGCALAADVHLDRAATEDP